MLYDLNTIADEFDLNTRTPKDPDQIGMEFEIEFHQPMDLSRFMDKAAPRHWLMEPDNSLRNGIELKSKTTSPYVAALDALRITFLEQGNKIRISNRCSVHIHINMKNNNIQDVVNFILLFACLEESLYGISGQRKGNIYCLGIQDAYFDYQNHIQAIAANAAVGKTVLPDTKGLKYSAVNLQRLHDLGTIEIRTMEGTTDTDRVRMWVEVLLAMKKNSQGRDLQEYITYLANPPEYIIKDVFTADQAQYLMCRNFSEFFRKGYYRVVGLVNSRINTDTYKRRLVKMMAKKSQLNPQLENEDLWAKLEGAKVRYRPMQANVLIQPGEMQNIEFNYPPRPQIMINPPMRGNPAIQAEITKLTKIIMDRADAEAALLREEGRHNAADELLEDAFSICAIDEGEDLMEAINRLARHV